MKRFALSLLAGLVALQASAATPDRLTIVNQYVDNVLTKAGDHYHDQSPTPLLADGVDPRTGKQMEWIFPDGRHAVLSNFLHSRT